MSHRAQRPAPRARGSEERERREMEGSVGEKRGRESGVLVDMQWKEMVTGGDGRREARDRRGVTAALSVERSE